MISHRNLNYIQPLKKHKKSTKTSKNKPFLPKFLSFSPIFPQAFFENFYPISSPAHRRENRQRKSGVFAVLFFMPVARIRAGDTSASNESGGRGSPGAGSRRGAAGFAAGNRPCGGRPARERPKKSPFSPRNGTEQACRKTENLQGGRGFRLLARA